MQNPGSVLCLWKAFALFSHWFATLHMANASRTNCSASKWIILGAEVSIISRPWSTWLSATKEWAFITDPPAPVPATFLRRSTKTRFIKTRWLRSMLLRTAYTLLAGLGFKIKARLTKATSLRSCITCSHSQLTAMSCKVTRAITRASLLLTRTETDFLVDLGTTTSVPSRASGSALDPWMITTRGPTSDMACNSTRHQPFFIRVGTCPCGAHLHLFVYIICLCFSRYLS